MGLKIIEKNVFELFDRENIPFNQKTILTKWVFKIKKLFQVQRNTFFFLDSNRNHVLISLIVTHLFHMTYASDYL